MLDNIDNSLKKTINHLIDTNNDITDYLYFFSSYIAANTDFKYTTTYLTDSIEEFSSDLEIFKSKFKLYKNISEEISNKSIDIEETYIIFDNIFKFKICKEIIFKLVDENIDTFNFRQLGKKQFTVKFMHIVNEFQTIEYTHKISTIDQSGKNRTIELFLNFLNYLKPRDDNK